MNIGLCIIATGKYLQFVPQLVESARSFFLPWHDVHYFVFSDAEPAYPTLRWIPTRHRAWPGPTLYRYRTMLAAEAQLCSMDYVYYCDADMRFSAACNDEILGDLVAVQHPGYAGKPREAFTYETRQQSTACVRPDEGTCYYAGGFQGGKATRFLDAAETMADRIDQDTRNGLTAVWHDESHWNRYCIDYPPPVVLPPLYCSPESWNVPDRKLVALDKNHLEMRT